MGLIKGFSWDLFISYARNDDVPEARPWVTRFVAQLREVLPQKLGSAKDLQIFFDRSDIHGPGELDPKIATGVRESAYFLALLSRSYVKSDYCIKELKYFLETNTRATEDLFLIDLDNVLADREFKPLLKDHLSANPVAASTIRQIRAVVRQRFWTLNEFNKIRILADDPSNPVSLEKFTEETLTLADNISAALLKKAGPTSPFPRTVRARNVDDRTRDYVTSSGVAADLFGLVEGFDHSDLASPIDEKAFLDGLEDFIRTELTRSRDKHFVELSMKLASATDANMVAPLYHSFNAALISFGEEQKLSDVSDLQALQRSLSDYGKLVMLAPPGSGKTTLLHHLTLKYIGDYRLGNSNFLPIFIPLAMYIRERGASVYPPAAEWIRRFLATVVPEDNFVHRDFDKLARAGRLIFILDGLDQLPDRRSQLARLEHLKRMETRVQRLALLAKAARLAGGQHAVSVLQEEQQAAFERTGPEIDSRERSIEALANETSSLIIVSCRLNDFIGVPRWQRIDVLPMSKEQVDHFVELYAGEAKEVVDQQWEADPATRSLVSNPFYLRMLTRAVEEGRVREATLTKDFRQILNRRGWLLSHLMWTGVLREVSGHKVEPTMDERQTAELVMNGLGDLAFFMMARNFIRGLTMEIVAEQLGDQTELIMKVASDAGIVDVSDGETASRRAIDFNHQLFLEVLLADYLRRRLNEAGQFQELLALLGKRGDRWAETLKLLSELLSPRQHNILMHHCIQALSSAETWDIATRVLAEIGTPAMAKLLEVTRKGNEIARRGAAQVLGQLGAQEAGDALMRMRTDQAGSVRRAAFEALYRLNRADALPAFRNDPSPAVRRSVYKAEMALSGDPLATASESFANQDPETAHVARAVREMFEYLVTRGPPDQIARLLHTMCDSKNEVVHITGYMLAGAAPDEVRHALKEKLLRACIVENDSVASLALQAVRGVLSHQDLERVALISQELESERYLDAFQQMRRKVRARTLNFEVQSQGDLEAYAKTLESVPLFEIQTVTNQIAARDDPAALAALTYLLRYESTARAAATAMCTMGSRGVDHFLNCLDDDVVEIRTRVAQLLRYCDLPHRYASMVRRNLKSEGFFALRPTGDFQSQAQLAPSLFAPVTAFMIAPFYAIVSWLFGSGGWYTYWVQYLLIERRFSRPLGFPKDKDPLLISNVEKLVFRLPKAHEQKDYWLARARIMSCAGETELAIRSLERALSIDPHFVEAAYELTLSLRKTGDLDQALRFATNIEDTELERMPKMRLLADLIELDSKSVQGDALSPDQRWTAIEVLWQLGEYAELLQRLKFLWYAESQLPRPFFLRLTDAYAGSGDPRGALGAALINNALSDAEEKISMARVEMWRSQIGRSDIDKEVLARFAVWTDLGSYQRAFDELCVAYILPRKGVDLNQTHIEKLVVMPDDLRPGIKACLEAINTDSDYLDRVSEILKLKY